MVNPTNIMPVVVYVVAMLFIAANSEKLHQKLFVVRQHFSTRTLWSTNRVNMSMHIIPVPSPFRAQYLNRSVVTKMNI
jgi:hypothetical protein